LAEKYEIDMTRKVYVENDFFGAYKRMFVQRGWQTVDNILEASLIQFTGGEDVSPSLYNELPHPKTFTNIERDRKEVLVYKIGLKSGIPMAGICRGGQFLNVMNGGKMWQHIMNGKHASSHDATDIQTGKTITVSSTHHQMMEPAKVANSFSILLVSNLGCTKEKVTKSNIILSVSGHKQDVEALLYYNTACLCFQPHPEFEHFSETREKYFEYLELIL